ncbi:unnamed protein product (mitochondrion) [Plasmodiophora brassicae]|uniref:Protein-serine/threonine kinase n=1 Tax=Plasmodiophora brassicae TaxID=37360 RepID=A0A3P3YDR0_PLABS|nr:unnamed protein product [Plasmodiophora brassicae]
MMMMMRWRWRVAGNAAKLYRRTTRRALCVSSFAMKEIRAFAQKPQTDVTLRAMFDIGRGVPSSSAMLVQSAAFLYEELPIRLAKRAVELTNLPYGLSNTPSVKKVQALYVDSFIKITSSPKPTNTNSEHAFMKIIQGMLQRHRDVVQLMAVGIKELKATLGNNNDQFIDECPYLQDFLDRFYFSRIGIRVLIAHHLSLHESRTGWVGIIQEQCSPAEVLDDAATNATETCERNYGTAPQVIVKGATDLRIPHIPDHIHYILYELLKNSMRAVVERYTDLGKRDDLPPIEVIISDGDDDIVMKVADCGGGIPRKDMQKVWTYAYSTAPTPQSVEDPAPQASIGPLLAAPMAGFGYGLPISRLHARAFKGDLILIPMHGYGLDAYLYLCKLATSDASAVPT